MKPTCSIILLALVAGCARQVQEPTALDIDAQTYTLHLRYEDGRPVPLASVVVGDPKTVGGAPCPDKNGVVKITTSSAEQVTVFVDGFPEKTIMAKRLKQTEANIITIDMGAEHVGGANSGSAGASPE